MYNFFKPLILDSPFYSDKACRLENENTSLTCKLEDQSLKLENASTSLNQYRAELELALEKSAVLEVQVQSQQDTAVSTEAEMQQIKETLESHRTQMSMSSSDALVIKSENNALKALVSSLQTKLTSLDGKLKQVLEPEAYTKLILAVQEEHQPEMAVIDDSSVVAFKDMLNSSIQECDRLKDELQIKTEECVQFEDLVKQE